VTEGQGAQEGLKFIEFIKFVVFISNN